MKQLFEQAGILLDDEQENMFCKYYQKLMEWNAKMNLTTVVEWEEVKKIHFLDSVMAARFISFEKGNNKNREEGFTCIDVGSGAGFPGMPLAILFPRLKVLLLDSLMKRVTFLNETIEGLALKNVKAIHGRAEDLGRELMYRENFDFAVSRAVANLSTLSEYCTPFLKVGGKFIAYKSIGVKSELEQYEKAFSLLNVRISQNYEFLLQGTSSTRNIVIIEKVSSTDDKYPRRTGKPLKKPLV